METMKHKLLRHTADIGGTLIDFSEVGQLRKSAGYSTGRDLHVDQYLTNVAIDYASQPFIATQICPVVPVMKQTDRYAVFSRMEHFSLEDDRRSPGKEANKVTRSVGSASYQCENYALGYDITIEDRANMDPIFRQKMDTGAGIYVIDKLMLNMEKRVLTLADASGSVTSVFASNSSWAISGANAGDPVVGVFQVIEYLQQLTGQRPNSILWGWKSWNYARRNYHLRNFINGTNNGRGLVTRQQVQDLFEMERFVVSEALWHTANEAHVNSFPLTANPIAEEVIVYYAPMNPSTDRPSWMYGFRWNNPALPSPLVIERHPYDSRRKVETIEAGYYQDERITGVDYAAKISIAVASGTGGVG